MKERELRDHAICDLCHKPIGHAGLPLFWVVTIERFGLHLRAISRQDGLTAILGDAYLASVMGPDEDMAESLLKVQITVCEKCHIERPLNLAEQVENKLSENDDD